MQLKNVGIDIDPRALIDRAQVGFMETRAAMQRLAPLVAKEKGLKATDYVEVMGALKQDQLGNDELEPHYRNVVMPELDRLIAQHDIVALPQRPMQMRLGSPAESASQPAPHFLPAPLVGNTGEQGTFVLPLGNPNAGTDGAYDDFNFPSVAWTLTAHEGRPGHELQFTAMVERERGVSLARTIYAFNSVNVEGWALYAEAEMIPYEPLDGQLFALQFRLMRNARAMLDPMLNLGLTDRDTAFKVLTDEVGLSKPRVQAAGGCHGKRSKGLDKRCQWIIAQQISHREGPHGGAVLTSDSVPVLRGFALAELRESLEDFSYFGRGSSVFANATLLPLTRHIVNAYR